ncbi:hypothetical protein N474_22245 [Pseudoalteromonas luteoviolacea CPMOR-2]|uniref:Cyclic peptide transporter n=1 Tax=Pseudoalteromonas luteoviolacea DSM 6061 TaxID=1365250 RepID=A0A167CBB7_9GAMM|nr:cyclic peptide export ABC transporter [Pseudoalteromonas luteoviolacea]KZN47460.1 hypothetical protein N475_06175 [Pseudoalteromonas luteoviolacea DSM 6061]KZN53058.1 hypothetical protein N474_22245 [Pseudoalteromonas luteoviolacea CPMOR-2]MBE0388648.1 putative ATP-binding cassette transporter [Pseudoalteromonas luteoviolacea DSM 6061]
MKLFALFVKSAPNKVFLSLVLGIVAGISYALLIPTVLNGIKSSSGTVREDVSNIYTLFGFEITNYKFAALFFFICIFILVTRTVSQVLLMRVATDVMSELRTSTYYRVMKAPLNGLEKVGAPKLIASITTDVGRIVTGARMLPDILISIVTVVGMLGFLLYLNPEVFGFLMLAILFGGVSYQLLMFIGGRYFSKSRQSIDELHESIKGLIQGAKELKLSEQKRESYFNDILLKHEKSVNKHDKSGNTVVSSAINYGDMISFFVIGMISFIFVSYHEVNEQALVGVVMGLLYITGPIGTILNSLPNITLANISYRKVTELFNRLPDENINATIKDIKPWETVTFSEIEYSYGADTDFKLGPITLEIKKSQITFIIGGNGSGKSTLSKILSLHEQPTSGCVLFDDEAVTADNLNSYREQVCAIYTSFYLFDCLLGEITPEKLETAQKYLTELGMDDKVTIDNGYFSTTRLSDGQRKRLALLVTFLEDRDIYLFDEWAADQDPQFKAVFYRQILPDLKRRGKAVIVISHDERYFDVADQLIVMENGSLVKRNQIDAVHKILEGIQ